MPQPVLVSLRAPRRGTRPVSINVCVGLLLLLFVHVHVCVCVCVCVCVRARARVCVCVIRTHFTYRGQCMRLSYGCWWCRLIPYTHLYVNVCACISVAHTRTRPGPAQREGPCMDIHHSHHMHICTRNEDVYTTWPSRDCRAPSACNDSGSSAAGDACSANCLVNGDRRWDPYLSASPPKD